MFAGWDTYVNETLKEGDPHYGNSYEALALYLWRHRSQSNLEMLKSLYDEGKVQGDFSNVNIDEDDVFPEEFQKFLGLRPSLRDVFLKHHGDLFEVDFWHQAQQMIRADSL